MSDAEPATWSAGLLILCLMLAAPVSAQEIVRVVYLGIAQDSYYEQRPGYTGLSLRDRKRPLEGARLAIRGARVLGRSLGLEFRLDEVIVDSADAVAGALADAANGGALAILLDLPASPMAEVLANWQSARPLLFDIRHAGARWRSGRCPPALLFTQPSYDMLSDALAQYLRRRGWDRILLLRGTAEQDVEQVAAVRRSLVKFGLTLDDERVFELSNDPRQREQNNVALMTARSRYDVVWVVDSDGEFGRHVPYATYAARPVVGSEGLTPRAWHWTFERYGAPQLNQRFRRLAGRDMSSGDWAAWIAVRTVLEGVQRTGSASPTAVAAHVRSDALSLDLYKGVPGSFRSWNGQLRQPVLLATHNAVIAVAPVEGFEHRTDTLDTLGVDRPESDCKP